MRQYQKILNSVLQWGCRKKFFFKVFEAYLINELIVFQNNIIEKYYKIGRSTLRRDISGLYKDGPDICRFLISKKKVGDKM